MEKDFENGLARKLNCRTIQPSENAWERVALQRGKSHKEQFGFRYWLAAAVAVGLIFTLMFVDSGDKGSNAEEVTDTGSESVKIGNGSSPSETKSVAKTRVADNGRPTRALNLHENNTDRQLAKRTPDSIIAQPIAATNWIEQQKIQEVTLAVEHLAEAGKQPTEDDVDMLIEKARRELAAGNGLVTPTDANTLLRDSESELDESFRSGVFENLFKHKKIKVVLSDH